MPYPPWVTRHKVKGTYVQKRGDKYYLYRGHSERVKGKPYPVLKFDAYLGQITEEHGLIEPTPSVRPGVQVYAYGVYYLGYRFCAPLVDRVSRRYGADVRVMTAVVLMQAAAGRWSPQGHEGTWLQVRFPDLQLPAVLPDEQQQLANRMELMVHDQFRQLWAGRTEVMLDLARRVYLVRVNNQWIVSEVPELLQQWADERQVLWEVE